MLVTEGGGDMLILLTGVGGALSALGRDIPVREDGEMGRAPQSVFLWSRL